MGIGKPWMVASAAVLVATLGLAPGTEASSYQALAGNTPTTLLSQATYQGAADQGEQVNLLIGLNFVQPAHMPDLPTFILDTVTPGNPYFHHYLTPSEFRSLYDQPAGAIQALEQYLESYGLTASQTETTNGVTYTSNNYLYVSGPVGAVERALSVSINHYTFQGRSFLANPQNPSLPTNYDGYDLAAMVSGISGLLTYSAFHPMTVAAGQMVNSVQLATCAVGGYADCTAPTGLSPQDTQRIYDAGGLTQAGITGQGVTIAIATLAPFLTGDPPKFWSYYGIDRTGSLTEIGVDQVIPAGGASGQGQGGSETDLDVEQSGSMAPGANIEVYVAPNTNNGFVDLFNAVVNGFDGVVPNVMSVSWGESEAFETPGYATLLNQQWEQGAAEGITMFDASGDSGAYDGYGYEGQNGLQVDSPADLTWSTAVGGTTLGSTEAAGISGIPTPAELSCMPATEQAWGWDYLLPCYQALGFKSQETAKHALYPVGSGGGFAAYFAEPSWQSAYGGALTGAAGKGVPDVAFNADPFTGYSILDSASDYTTASAPWTDGWGGTSFAAPNWAGLTALIDQYVGGSVGFLPPTLYQLANAGGFRDITTGDNWYYQAGPGWDAATGLGVPDITRLAETIDNYIK
jgi:kumamolisin